jgi:hypothetical protein
MAWSAPANVAELVAADPDQTWQDDQFAPVLITVMGGTLSGAREVPLLWQIQFEPADLEGTPGEARLADLDLDTDGYGWTALILGELARRYPAHVRFVRSDEEAATCVLCAEQADVFEKVVEVTLAAVAGDGYD